MSPWLLCKGALWQLSNASISKIQLKVADIFTF
jgi:hypothetical protein